MVNSRVIRRSQAAEALEDLKKALLPEIVKVLKPRKKYKRTNLSA